MILHKYSNKILIKIPVDAFEFEIIETKDDKYLSYKTRPNGRAKTETIDLNFPFAEEIGLGSIFMRINVDKLEVYNKIKKRKNAD